MLFRIFSAFVVVCVMAVVGSTTAQAKVCYSKFETEAEQGLRIHSELMVIGLTCQKVKGGKDLYHKYKLFTAKHAPLIEEYENSLISFYRRQGHAKPDKSLHKLRTDLGNKISQHAAKLGAYSFCKQFSGRIDKALEMSRDTVRKWSQQSWPNQKTSYPACYTASYN